MAGKIARLLTVRAATVAFVLSGCAKPNDGPVFNAIDRSLVCDTGKVGWDFTTGGGANGEAYSSEPIRGIRIKKATYGANCNNSAAVNFQSKVEGLCNGVDSCNWLVTAPTDPAPGCEKNAVVEWSCGVESPVYRLDIGGEAGNKTLTPKCGAKLTITDAFFGFGSSRRVDKTSTVAATCNGLRQCKFAGLPGLYGEGNLWGLLPNMFNVAYTCGNSPTVYYGSQWMGDLTLQCDVEPDPKSPVIHVQTGSYGTTCSNYSSSLDSMKTVVSNACENKVSCSFDYNASGGKDAAYGCHKSTTITYTCGTDPGVRTLNLTAGANPAGTLSCATQAAENTNGIRLVSATLGANCRAPAGNWTTAVNTACSGRTKCDYVVSGADPAVGCAKNFSVTYKCGNEATPYTVSATAEATGKTVSLACAPAIHVIAASYGSNACRTQRGSLTNAVTSSCDGKRGSCVFAIANPYSYDPAPNCAKDFEVQYRCGLDPTVQVGTVAGEASGKSYTINCPEPAANALKKCIPDTCYGQTKRLANMTCGADTTIPVVSKFEMGSVSIRSNEEYSADSKVLRGNTAYTIQATYGFTAAATETLDTRLAIWATDVFQNNSNANDKIEGFSCLITHVHLNTPGTTSSITTSDYNNFISPECFSQKNTWGDAANRLGRSETALRQQYKYVGSKLHASFDPNGDTVYFPKQSNAPSASDVSAKAMPNPPGFYFDPAKNWVDLAAYYQQREVTIANNTTMYTFVPATRIELGIASAALRTSSLEVGLFAVQTPKVDLDFNWYMSGQNPTNPYMPATSSTGGVVNLSARHMTGFIEMYPVGSPTDYMVLGDPNGVPLSNGLITGDTVTTRSIPSDPLITKLFDGWKDKTTFGVRVCMAVDGIARSPGSTKCLPNAQVLGTNYNVCIGPNRYCAEAGSLVVTRDWFKHSVQKQSTSSSINNAKTNSSGDARMKGNADSAQTSDCTQPTGSTNTVCTSYRRNSNQSDGNFGRTYYSSSATSTRNESDTNEVSTVDAQGEMLGFQILDSGEDGHDEQQKVNGIWQKGKPPITIKITPNWEFLIATEKEATKAVVPVKPTFEKGKYANTDGIGVGIGATVPFQIGPIPGELSISATVGVSLSFEFQIQFEPEEAYACLGAKGNKCFAAVSKLMTQAEASRHCGATGGRLAEILTSSDRTAVDAATASANQEFWTGASLNYKYSSIGCAKNETADCAANANISFRWGGSDTEFATGTSQGTYVNFFGIQLFRGANFTAGAIAADKIAIPASAVSLGTTAPSTGGLAYHGTGHTLKTHPGGDKLASVCEYDAAPNYRFAGFSAKLTLGAGAGVGLSVCIPKSEFGVCISGSVNFVELKLEPTLTYSNYTLLDSSKRRFGSRGNVNVSVPWDVTLLHAQIEAEIKAFIFSISWTIIEFPGFRVAGGNLFNYDWPTRENY